MPTGSANPYGGIFQYLVHINGTDAEVRAAQAKLSQLTPTTAAVYQVLNLLPEGGLKSWVMANPIQFWSKIWTAIFGRHYTSGDYALGQMLNENIYCQPHISANQVSDDMVAAAHLTFNMLWGVRIATNNDMNALRDGKASYKAREASQGISDEAIDRAVYLTQTYYQPGTGCIDLNIFEKYPLVAPIPDYELGKWYTGPLPGGSNAVDGVIPVSAQDILKQYVGADFNPATGVTTAAGDTTHAGLTLTNIYAKIKANPVAAISIAAAAAFAIHELTQDD